MDFNEHRKISLSFVVLGVLIRTIRLLLELCCKIINRVPAIEKGLESLELKWLR